MNHAPLKRFLFVLPVAMIAIAAVSYGARAQSDSSRTQSDNEGLDLSIELVDPKVLRVCADPRNLPFSRRMKLSALANLQNSTCNSGSGVRGFNSRNTRA